MTGINRSHFSSAFSSLAIAEPKLMENPPKTTVYLSTCALRIELVFSFFKGNLRKLDSKKVENHATAREKSGRNERWPYVFLPFFAFNDFAKRFLEKYGNIIFERSVATSVLVIVVTAVVIIVIIVIAAIILSACWKQNRERKAAN